MEKPRRALIDDDAPEPKAAFVGWKVWLAVAVALALIGGGVAAALLRPRNNQAIGPSENVTSTAPQSTDSSSSGPHSAEPSASGSDATPSTSAASSPSLDDQATAKALEQLKGCKAKVAAGDEVINAGKVGSGHWAEHVQAQKDADDGLITVAQMKDIFTRTRLAGPADEQRYAAAKQKLVAASKGTCDPVAGASTDVAAQMAGCKQRLDAQPPVLSATEKTMTDWSKHLVDMNKSREGHVRYAQGVWLRTYQAAPPNIEAWKKAVSGYKPPTC